MGYILYQIFKTILSTFLKKYNENNSPIKTYVNKKENRITFKIKTGYYLELLTPQKIKLLGNTKNKITKDKNREIVPHP